jgi:hypothetical protein
MKELKKIIQCLQSFRSTWKSLHHEGQWLRVLWITAIGRAGVWLSAYCSFNICTLSSKTKILPWCQSPHSLQERFVGENLPQTTLKAEDLELRSVDAATFRVLGIRTCFWWKTMKTSHTKSNTGRLHNCFRRRRCKQHGQSILANAITEYTLVVHVLAIHFLTN